jgi:DNA mismatch repair ATPase MutS
MNNTQRLASKLNGLMSVYSVKLQQQAYERRILSNGKVFYTDRWHEIEREMKPLESEIEKLDNYLYQIEIQNEL